MFTRNNGMAIHITKAAAVYPLAVIVRREQPGGIMSMKEKQLALAIEDDQLKISIGVDVLQHACEIGRAYSNGDIQITDQDEFLSGLVRELEREDEDGGTLLHRAFDRAVSEMLENGERGVDLLDDA